MVFSLNNSRKKIAMFWKCFVAMFCFYVVFVVVFVVFFHLRILGTICCIENKEALSEACKTCLTLLWMLLWNKYAVTSEPQTELS